VTIELFVLDVVGRLEEPFEDFLRDSFGILCLRFEDDEESCPAFELPARDLRLLDIGGGISES
jgi:hypothetical protein